MAAPGCRNWPRRPPAAAAARPPPPPPARRRRRRRRTLQLASLLARAALPLTPPARPRRPARSEQGADGPGLWRQAAEPGRRRVRRALRVGHRRRAAGCWVQRVVRRRGARRRQRGAYRREDERAGQRADPRGQAQRGRQGARAPAWGLGVRALDGRRCCRDAKRHAAGKACCAASAAPRAAVGGGCCRVSSAAAPCGARSGLPLPSARRPAAGVYAAWAHLTRAEPAPLPRSPRAGAADRDWQQRDDRAGRHHPRGHDQGLLRDRHGGHHHGRRHGGRRVLAAASCVRMRRCRPWRRCASWQRRRRWRCPPTVATLCCRPSTCPPTCRWRAARWWPRARWCRRAPPSPAARSGRAAPPSSSATWRRVSRGGDCCFPLVLFAAEALLRWQPSSSAAWRGVSTGGSDDAHGSRGCLQGSSANRDVVREGCSSLGGNLGALAAATAGGRRLRRSAAAHLPTPPASSLHSPRPRPPSTPADEAAFVADSAETTAQLAALHAEENAKSFDEVRAASRGGD